MEIYHDEPVQAEVRPITGEYLQTRYYLRENASTRVTVGRGAGWTPLACKEVYGKAAKTARELGCESCLFDLTAAAELGEAGICAALEGIAGGCYRQKFALSGRWEPEMACYLGGAGWTENQIRQGRELARSIMEARNLVNRPANLLTPEDLAETAVKMMEGLPVETRIYRRDELAERGLGALLAIGDSSGHPPVLAVFKYTGAPSSGERLGYVGKGLALDTGGYCLKNRNSMEGIKRDMAGAAAAAGAVRALAAVGANVNVTAVIPACENRISSDCAVPGDVIRSLSGQTIEIINTDAEGRLVLADGITWAIREEGCTRIADIATLTGAIYAMLGRVASGVMYNDGQWYERLEKAAEVSGEKFWPMPVFSEYERLIKSDLADVRNHSRDGCGAIAAGLFLKRFTEGRPWLHLDIAGTANVDKPVWQHQVSGATGAAVSTLFHLARGMEQSIDTGDR